MGIKQDLMLAFVDCVERNGAKLATPRTVVRRRCCFSAPLYHCMLRLWHPRAGMLIRAAHLHDVRHDVSAMQYCRPAHTRPLMGSDDCAALHLLLHCSPPPRCMPE